MSITVLDYKFEGPFDHPDSLKNRSGVFVLLNKVNRRYFVIDAGESSWVKRRVVKHNRKNRWMEEVTGELRVAAYYTDKETREIIERLIQREYRPPCCRK